MTVDALKEVDLFPPLHDFLVARGYTVRAEVEDCDILAQKDDLLLAVELKLRFNLELLLQATARQSFADLVYVALPRPQSARRRRKWPSYQRLLRRLELGLIFVVFADHAAYVEIVFDPKPYRVRKQNKKREKVLTEMEGRTVNYNLGGGNRQKLMTAYREAALKVASLLARAGTPMAPRQLRQLGTAPNTGRILYDNYYDWFERIGHGLYTISGKGRQALSEYSEVMSLRENKKGN